MPLTLGQAALQAGKSKPTILKALKTGRMSAVKVGNEWQIEPAELFRVYPQTTMVNTNSSRSVNPPDNTIEIAVLEAKLEAAQQQIEDLKSDRDAWRNQANLLLAAPQTPPQKEKTGFIAALFGRK